jgi:hypothetical protein
MQKAVHFLFEVEDPDQGLSLWACALSRLTFLEASTARLIDIRAHIGAAKDDTRRS